MKDHVAHRLHTGGLYLTKYVTSEGNWLHYILFRGFIANGVNTCARTTFFFSSLHKCGLFCVCPLHEIQIKIYLKGTVAAVRGYAGTGGLELALLADLSWGLLTQR